jgi:hypothetical protein
MATCRANFSPWECGAVCIIWINCFLRSIEDMFTSIGIAEDIIAYPVGEYVRINNA